MNQLESNDNEKVEKKIETYEIEPHDIEANPIEANVIDATVIEPPSLRSKKGFSLV
jgi:hypothetical protein